MSTDLGVCPCGASYERREVQINLTVDEQPIAVEHVLQGCCPSCGSRVYKASDLEDIEALMGSRAARPLPSP